jgi:hypothetical protein
MMRCPPPRISLAVFAVALVVLPSAASAVLLTYAVVGTASPITPWDDYNVLLGQVEPSVTELYATFQLDSVALDGNPNVDRASYHFGVDANAFVANIGELRFRNDANRVLISDDLTLSGGPDLYDRMSVFANGNFDPVVWPAFGYQLFVDFMAMQVDDSDEDDLTLAEGIAPVPALGSFGGTNFFGTLQMSGCRLLGGATSCGTTHRFEIMMDVHDVFLVPEPATAALLGLGVAALARKRPGC